MDGNHEDTVVGLVGLADVRVVAGVLEREEADAVNHAEVDAGLGVE